MKLRILALALGLSFVSGHRAQADEPHKLLHVSFGFTKAFYAEYNASWYSAVEVQELFAKHNFRPRVKAVEAKTAKSFPAITLVKEKAIFTARDERAQLAEGGTFDSLVSKRATK